MSRLLDTGCIGRASDTLTVTVNGAWLMVVIVWTFQWWPRAPVGGVVTPVYGLQSLRTPAWA